MSAMQLRRKMRKLINALGIDIHRFVRKPGTYDFLTHYNMKTVLDIGANIGQSALEFRALLPSARIYSFEPLPDCFEKLVRTMGKDVNFKGFPIALGATAERVSIQESSYSPSSFLLRS